MNARVEPAAMRASGETDDAALIAQCRLAIRAIERELAAMEMHGDLDDRYYISRPPYPTLPWMLGVIVTPDAVAPPAHPYSAERLRTILEELREEAGPAWCLKMQAQIEAVVAWERECAALRKASGLAKADRLCAAARARSLDCMRPVPGMPARTPEGAALKATALAFWLEANAVLDEDCAEDIVRSVVDDTRRLGLARARQSSGRRRAA